MTAYVWHVLKFRRLLELLLSLKSEVVEVLRSKLDTLANVLDTTVKPFHAGYTSSANS